MITRDRIVSAALVAFVVAGCICIAVALYASAFADELEGSLILAVLLPAYLAVSYSTPMPRRGDGSVIEDLTHDARIVDSGEPDDGTQCEFWHEDPTNPGRLLPIDFDATLRLYLATPYGLRYADICDDPAHDDLKGVDLLWCSTALDEAQRDLEDEVDSAVPILAALPLL